jgi:hypothetical protein
MNFKGYRALQVLVAAFFTCLLFFLFSGSSQNIHWPQGWGSSHLSRNVVDDRYLAHVLNQTLGVRLYMLYSFISSPEIDFLQFEHIYAIGFQARTDKRDLLTLAASETGFKVEWLEGVKPEDLLQKAMPNVCFLNMAQRIDIHYYQHRE